MTFEKAESGAATPDLQHSSQITDANLPPATHTSSTQCGARARRIEPLDRLEADMRAALYALETLARSAPVQDDETAYHATLLLETFGLVQYAARELAADRRQWRRRALSKEARL